MLTHQTFDDWLDPGALTFQFGAEVFDGGRRLGDLRSLWVTPGFGTVTHLEVARFPFGRARCVPLEDVVATGPDRIEVRLRGDGVRPKSLRVREGASVWGSDRRAGQLLGIQTTAGGALREMVVESGGWFARKHRVPASQVAECVPRLRLRSPAAGLADLPLLRTDVELRAAILDRWFYDLYLRQALLAERVEVYVRDGEVTLRGNVTDEQVRRRLVLLAETVAGVRGVTSHLASDEVIREEVAQLLGSETGTRSLWPRVTTELGVVSLAGDAGNPAVAKLATELAGRVAGVRGVENRMRVPRDRC